MELEYSVKSAEKVIIDLLKKTLSKKGAKGVRNLLDDIMNERALNVKDDLKNELQKYSTDTLRLIVEKEILLSLENSSLANRKSYWDVLKSRAPRIKTGIMAHYYDNFINTLKQENPATYQARTINELKEVYDNEINNSFHVINETGETILNLASSIDVNTKDKTVSVNNEQAGSLELDNKTNIKDGKFVNKDELMTALNRIENLPNGKGLITDNPNISINDIKNITNSLSGNLNVISNEGERTVTLGQAGIKEVGNLSYDDTPTLPDGTYVSMEELSIAINNFINKPVTERKKAKVLSIRQEFRKQMAMVAMSFTILTAAIPVLKNKIQNNVIPAITQEIDNGVLSSENIMTTVNEQVANISAGAANVQEVVSGALTKATEFGNEAVDALMQVPEIFQTNQVAPEVTTPSDNVVAEVSTDASVETTPLVAEVDEGVSGQPVEDVASEEVSEPVESVVSEEVSEPVEEVSEPVEEIKEETTESTETPEVKEEVSEEPIEEVQEELVEENRLATPDDFSFRYDESNIIAAAARNMGFTDEQILIAVAISREETGNYTSPAFLEKNNYGGMTLKDHVRMSFDSKEEGLERFLLMLKNGYFDKGLTTVDSIGPVYDPESTTWPSEVRGCMEKNGINPPTEDVETVEETTEEVTEPVEEVQPVEEATDEVEETVEEVSEAINETEEINQEKLEVKSNMDTPVEAVVEEPIQEEKVETPIVEEPVIEQPTLVVSPIASETEVTKQEQISANQNIAATQNSSDAAAALLGITPEQLDVVKATIRHEAGNNPAEIANVASCVRNRMISRAANPYAVITAAGQFESYLGGHYRKYTGGNYYQGDPETAEQVSTMIDAILTGTMAPTHGYENFRSASSPYGVQLVDGGNKYR